MCVSVCVERERACVERGRALVFIFCFSLPTAFFVALVCVSPPPSTMRLAARPRPLAHRRPVGRAPCAALRVTTAPTAGGASVRERGGGEL